jgi:hypothetical protein
MKETRRTYAMPDKDMLTSSKTLVTHAREDYEELKKVDPTLTIEMVEKWDDEVNDGLEDFSSLQARSSITIATQLLNDVMEECRNTVQLVYFHVEQEFVENPNMILDFGKRGVDKARKNPEKMISLLSLILCTYERPEIGSRLKVRFPANFKETLVSLKQRLTTAHVQQSFAKSNQPAETENRLLKYNAIWEFTRKISETGKIAFRSSYAKLQQYTLYDTPPAKKEGVTASKNTDLPAKEEIHS